MWRRTSTGLTFCASDRSAAPPFHCSRLLLVSPSFHPGCVRHRAPIVACVSPARAAAPRCCVLPRCPSSVPVSARRAYWWLPLFFEPLQTGSYLIQILARLHGREVERRNTIPVERREESGGVLIQHRDLFGLGRRSLGKFSTRPPRARLGPWLAAV